MGRKRRVGDDVFTLDLLTARGEARIRFAKAMVAFPGASESDKFFSDLIRKALVSRVTRSAGGGILRTRGEDIFAAAHLPGKAEHIVIPPFVDVDIPSSEPPEVVTVQAVMFYPIFVSDKLFVSSSASNIPFAAMSRLGIRSDGVAAIPVLISSSLVSRSASAYAKAASVAEHLRAWSAAGYVDVTLVSSRIRASSNGQPTDIVNVSDRLTTSTGDPGLLEILYLTPDDHIKGKSAITYTTSGVVQLTPHDHMARVKSSVYIKPTISLTRLGMNAFEYGEVPQYFRFSRVGDLGPLTVHYELMSQARAVELYGTGLYQYFHATPGTDYETLSPYEVEFAQGETYVDVAVTPNNDSTLEIIESVFVELVANSAYYIHPSSYYSRIGIINNPPSSGTLALNYSAESALGYEWGARHLSSLTRVGTDGGVTPHHGSYQIKTVGDDSTPTGGNSATYQAALSCAQLEPGKTYNIYMWYSVDGGGWVDSAVLEFTPPDYVIVTFGVYHSSFTQNNHTVYYDEVTVEEV
jgi:hypothetical protein